MSKYSFRVEIEVSSDVTPTDASIGLFSGKFIWIVGDEYSFTTSSKGVLSNDWINGISKSVSVDRMGDIANIDGLSLKIKNTNKFWVKFITAFGDNFSLHGSKVSIYEMTPSGATYLDTLLYIGYCDLPSFNKSTYNIPVRGSGDVRNSYMTKPITSDFLLYNGESYVDDDAIGKILPITFGSNKKAFFLKTGELEELAKVSDDYGTYRNFPINNKVSSTAYYVNIYNTTSVGFSYSDLTSKINGGRCFLKVVEGTGSGEMCLIESYSYISNGILRINLSRPFSVIDGLVADDSVVQFVEIINRYNSDFWHLKGFYQDDEPRPNNQVIYTYNEGFKQIPSSSIEADSSITNNNAMQESPVYYEDGKIIGFDFVQDAKCTRVFDNQAFYWFGNSWTYFNTLGCLVPSGSLNIGSYTINNDYSGDTRTKDGSNPALWDVVADLPIGCNRDFIKGYEIEVPDDIPSAFDSVHLLVGVRFESSLDSNIDFNVVKKKWYEPSNTEVHRVNQFQSAGVQYDFTNFPFDYDTTELPNTFWVGGQDTGFVTLDLGVSNKEELDSLSKILFYMKFEGSLNTQSIRMDVFSAGFCFKKSSDTSNGVYTELKGRVWNDDIYPLIGWTTNELIQTPIEAMAHTKLLQNYSNDGVTAPAGGWGYDYSSASASSLINLAQNSVGSFYHNDFINFGWSDTLISKQVVDSKESTTKAITKSLCNQFFLVNWVNNAGLECVAQIAQKSALTITETITQAKMTRWGDRREQDSRNIFVEPIVSYGYNPVSKTFDGTIAITDVSSNLSTESEKANAVKGLDNYSENYKANLWDKCKALYNYYGVINEPPKILSEQTWIGSIDDAEWYLRKWLRFMGVGIVDGVAKVVPKTYFDFSVPYEVGRLWDIGTRINVQVPNITDNSPFEAFIYSIKKNISLNMPTIDVKVILFDQDTVEEYDIQDSYDDTLETWQDTTDSNEDIIQDEV